MFTKVRPFSCPKNWGTSTISFEMCGACFRRNEQKIQEWRGEGEPKFINMP